MARLAAALLGTSAASEEIVAQRGQRADLARVWDAWCALAAELVFSLVLTLDPDVVVLAGGLSRIDGIAEDVGTALSRLAFHDMPLPAIACAEGGDAAGARGAALFALDGDNGA